MSMELAVVGGPLTHLQLVMSLEVFSSCGPRQRQASMEI
ncbi:hypothetical protein SLEP1_g9591 [Rubroshorea leprosula]|uniref:Uncharacterized protein n=1 Tax=Rubroshorea leprosula TaxID=152421 RepID=A0AAV5IBD5_9ROSI|nr:hypothetical protein SLEP1_g9591 [Rubroshorea leprosula]